MESRARCPLKQTELISLQLIVDCSRDARCVWSLVKVASEAALAGTSVSLECGRMFLKHAVVSLLYMLTTLLPILGNLRLLGLLEGMLVPQGGSCPDCKHQEIPLGKLRNVYHFMYFLYDLSNCYWKASLTG